MKELKELPVCRAKQEIVEILKTQQVVIITAETGAGKSTQVPQFLLDEGYELIVTEPRRLAARTLAIRVAEERGEELGKTVGYRTAVDAVDSSETRCLFCTDGLALVKELMGQNSHKILVLDEVHEWNKNIEVLIAWAKKEAKDKSWFRLVIMSATLEAKKLAQFYEGAHIISVPGRLFPVESRLGDNIEEDVADLVSQGRNVLVFQPGKEEIFSCISKLQDMGLVAEILPLHGQLEPAEQALCFKNYHLPKVVVSTNVAQTSVTINDIDAVVDSGLERRTELAYGVEGLYMKSISQSDSLQRQGRAGRTKPGIYLHYFDDFEELQKFSVPEILRTRLDQTVLRFAGIGIDMEKIDFFHQPNIEEIKEAKRALEVLGCLKEGRITSIGKWVNRLPVSVKYGRMLYEARDYKVVSDVITITAIMEAGGITGPVPNRRNWQRPDWRFLIEDPVDRQSDLLASLALWKKAKTMTKEEMKEKGISLKKYYRAQEIRQKLVEVLRPFVVLSSSGDKESILKSICAGMVDHVYKNSMFGYVNGEQNTYRQLNNSSIVASGDFLLGLPFDLEIKARYGTRVLNLIEMATPIKLEWLQEVAPQLFVVEKGLEPYYDREEGICYSYSRTFFNGQKVKEAAVPDKNHPQASRLFASWFFPYIERGIFNNDRADEVVDMIQVESLRRRKLNAKAGARIFNPLETVDDLEAEGFMDEKCCCLSDANKFSFQKINSEQELDILEKNPDSLMVGEVKLNFVYNDRNVFNEEEFEVICNLSLKQLKALPQDRVYLPSGRTVKLCYLNYSDYSSQSLISTLNQVSINELWRQKQAEIETVITDNDSWEDIRKKLPTVNKLEIGQVNGSTVYAYPALQHLYGGRYSVDLALEPFAGNNSSLSSLFLDLTESIEGQLGVTNISAPKDLCFSNFWQKIEEFETQRKTRSSGSHLLSALQALKEHFK